MTLGIVQLLYFVAAICFFLAATKIEAKVDFMNLGFFVLTIALVIR